MISAAIIVMIVILLLAGLLLVVEICRRNAHIWLPAYIAQKRSLPVGATKHILFCFCDHFEPRWRGPDYDTEVKRIQEWTNRYPRMAKKFRDADGCMPKHSFFYPEEEYRPEHIDRLADLCKQGFGEIEIHLHHNDDTEANLRSLLSGYIDTLHHQHGALAVNPQTGKPMFGFIHGNWALDNSAPDGSACGINNELIILRELGCYADFTLPSAPDGAQTRKINSIYYAKDDPHQPKSHDTGQDVRVGGVSEGDLLLIQGPLGINWKRRKWGLIPRIETGEIRGGMAGTADRVDLWVQNAPKVEGRPDWLFVKIYTHGAQEDAQEEVLGEPVRAMHRYLNQAYNDGRNYQLHYMSAREMYNLVKAAEAGCEGNPNDYRNYILPLPPML